MRKKTKRKIYKIENSPLWQLRSQKAFAELLGLKKARFKKLTTEREFHYKTWTGEANGKVRKFAVPVGSLRRVHERLKNLLDRIEKPSYLFSPRSGRSPVENAILHFGSEQVFKIDIRQFYPSTTREHIFRFCRHRLQMSDDVAGAFAKLATFGGIAPFGSPLSPILCFLAHKDMFDEMDRLCVTDDNKFSLWVDDITISGPRVSGTLMHEIRRLIESKGFRHHKEQSRHTASGIVVTGSHVSKKLVAPANKHHLKMFEKLKTLDETSDPSERLALVNSLIGMTTNAMAIYPRHAEAFKRAAKRQQWLHGQRRELRKEVGEICGKTAKTIIVSDSVELPWE
jgi:RNA-directed DNA polymerase